MRGKIFDFDAWYRAHFFDQFGSPLQRNQYFYNSPNSEQHKFKGSENHFDSLNENRSNSYQRIDGKKMNFHYQTHTSKNSNMDKQFSRLVFIIVFLTISLKFYENFSNEHQIDKNEESNKNK